MVWLLGESQEHGCYSDGKAGLGKLLLCKSSLLKSCCKTLSLLMTCIAVYACQT